MSGTKRKILIVGDEPAIREIARSFFDRREHEVVEAAAGAAGLSYFEAEPERYALVILDFFLEDTPSTMLLRHFRSLAPDLPCLLYMEEERDLDEIPADLRANTFQLVKPYHPDDFSQLLGAIFVRAN